MPFSIRKIRSSEEDYQYKPLRDKNSDIRILVLNSKGLCKPGVINGSIYHAYLGTKPDYEFLSCAWSSKEEHIPVFVGLRRRRLSIPKSLANALLDLQHQTDSRQLWIDATCIDQQNRKEKSQHVATRMADIYKKAARVTYWLGPGDESSTVALSVLQQMSKMVVVDWNARSISPSQFAKNAAGEIWSDTTNPLPLSDEQLRAISNLLCRDWFNRVWSLQEIWLTGLKAIFVCGKAFIKLVNFHVAIICLYLKKSSCCDPETDLPGQVERVTRLCHASDNAALSSLLDFVRNATCDDPKDKVYGILDMIHPQYKLQIEVNYDRTALEVYRDLILQCIKQKSRLDILRYCHLDDRHKGMPSWIPNLAKEGTQKSFPEWSADADSTCDAEPFCATGVLKVHGRHVATVRGVQWIRFGDDTDSIISTIRRLTPSNLDAEYVSGGSVFDAYCRTLGADQFSDITWPPASEWIDFISSRVALKRILGLGETDAGCSDDMQFLHTVDTTMQNCQFLTTKEGYIGLGPPAARAGDQVCVLPGSRGLMLLRPRPSPSDQHEVVGQAFVYGLMKGEGLLGPVPEPFQPAMRQDPTQGWTCGFLNRETKEWWSGEDPRLNPFRDDVTYDQTRDVSSSQQKNLRAEAVDTISTIKRLLQENVALQSFHLV